MEEQKQQPKRIVIDNLKIYRPDRVSVKAVDLTDEQIEMVGGLIQHFLFQQHLTGRVLFTGLKEETQVKVTDDEQE